MRSVPPVIAVTTRRRDIRRSEANDEPLELRHKRAFGVTTRTACGVSHRAWIETCIEFGTMRRILAALDDSVRTKPVLQTAIDLAKQYRASLVLFRAVDVPPEFPPAAATHHTDELRPKLLSDATNDLDELAAVARSLGVEATTVVVVSTEPWRAIIDAAQSRDADAIVVGSHGYRVIDRLLGTTAARVADRAKGLVIVVHGPGASAEGAPPSSGPYRTKS